MASQGRTEGEPVSTTIHLYRTIPRLKKIRKKKEGGAPSTSEKTTDLSRGGNKGRGREKRGSRAFLCDHQKGKDSKGLTQSGRNRLRKLQGADPASSQEGISTVKEITASPEGFSKKKKIRGREARTEEQRDRADREGTVSRKRGSG